MAITHSPSIVTNGLLLHYDMNNKKSFAGQPTTNLLTSTEDFTVWSQYNTSTVTANQEFAPNSTFTADKVVNTTNGTSSIYRDAAGSGNSTVALSLYVKPITSSTITLQCYFLGNVTAGFQGYYNLVTGQPISGAASSYTIEPAGNGWYRLKIVGTGTNSLNNTIRLEVYSGTLGDSYYVWGAQIEINGFVTPYVLGTRSNTQAILNLANSYESQSNYMPYPYAGYNGSSFPLAASKSDLGATYNYVTSVANPVNAPGVLQYYTGTGGYQYFSIISNTVSIAGRYTFSYYARLTGGSTSSSFGNSQIWRLTDGSDAYNSATIIAGDWNPTITSNWKRYVISGIIPANLGLQIFVVHSSSLVGGITVQYCGFQLERGSVATPFNPSTTSSKLTNTITASSLTYASDNTFSFNGSSNYITATANTDFQFLGVQPFTLEAWVYPTSNPGANGFPGIICRESNPGSGRDGYNLLFHGSATTETSFAIERFSAGVGGASYFHYLDSSITLNNWHHIVATFDGYTLILYRNGSAVGSASQSTAITNTAAPLNIGMLGQTPASTLNFPGKIAVAKIYKNALTAAEVLQNFNALRGRFGL